METTPGTGVMVGACHPHPLQEASAVSYGARCNYIQEDVLVRGYLLCNRRGPREGNDHKKFQIFKKLYAE